MPTTTHRKAKAGAHKKRGIALGTALCSTLGAGVVLAAGPAGPAGAASSQRDAKIHEIADVARNQRGDEYQYGADGPDAFDCSGLVEYSYEKRGIRMPRTSDAQATKAERIPRSQMQEGDLMFFTDGGDVYHVGIFGGWDDGRRWMINASEEGEPVKSQVPWTGEWYPATVR
jgi:cell wall-associated NlpC family hydrolase